MRTLPPLLAPFAAVGGIGFVVQVGLLSLLTRVAGLDPGPATALAVELTILHNFAWHERWTWAHEAGGRAGGAAARLLRFNAAALGKLALNLAVTVVACRLWHLPPEAANLLAVAIGSAVNYSAIDRVVLLPHARRNVPSKITGPVATMTGPAGRLYSVSGPGGSRWKPAWLSSPTSSASVGKHWG